MTSVDITFTTDTTHTHPIKGAVTVHGHDDLDTLINATRAVAIAMGYTAETVARITLLATPGGELA